MPHNTPPPSRSAGLPTAWSVELDRSLSRFTARAFERLPQDPLLGLFPFIHYACKLAPLSEVRHWVRRHVGLEVSEAQLRHAMSWPDRHWSHLWRMTLRPAGSLLARASGWSLEEVLFGDDALTGLRDELPDLWLGDLASTNAALDQIDGALRLLAQRWYALDPGTREAARRYLGPVVQVCRIDAGLSRPPWS